ncbi:MAG TPA: AmmeMemoRadiSam system protein A [Candidatus Diapherotrites archaeon]|uniref:AmmeMemoRadiSam system protein A n=1 Tax=Candidatus Iainarchaeum sp. TaxID=3101447 RepID=A0A7J4IUL4_9ARCH|nr:AmmeMemoRadiSam system protein A [Candidatus Diapherotrites archaeon]
MAKGTIGEYAIQLCRRAIGNFLENSTALSLAENEVPLKALKEKKGCFVTLHKGGELRGCIGNIGANAALYESIARNAALAAFNDPRFAPLSAKEFPAIDIEVSVLSKPVALRYKSPQELLKKLNRKKGVIICKGGRSATFLPQVWTHVKGKEQFLSELCMKAGLGSDGWKGKGLCVQTYTVKAYKEKRVDKQAMAIPGF